MDATGLRRLAGRRGLALGILEKDQAITAALGFLAGLPAVRSLAFKGGTALSKIHFPGYRFSEDLDFTASGDVSTRILRSERRLLAEGLRTGVRFLAIQRIPGSRAGRSIRIRYADFNGHPNSIRVEMSLREAVQLPVEWRPLLDPYGVLTGRPLMPTMDLREIAAEKVRALCMRSQPRDLYDLAFLLDHRVPSTSRSSRRSFLGGSRACPWRKPASRTASPASRGCGSATSGRSWAAPLPSRRQRRPSARHLRRP